MVLKKELCNTKSLEVFSGSTFLLIIIALTLSFLGAGLKFLYSEVVLVWPWIVLIILMAVSGSIMRLIQLQRFRWFRFVNSYWIWGISALLLNASAFYFGHFHNGVLRTIGSELFQIRVSLWSLVLIVFFLNELSHQIELSWQKLALVAGMFLVYYLMLLEQPELYTQLILILLLMGFSFVANGRMRYLLLGMTGTGLSFILLALLSSPYRVERFMYGWLNTNGDHLGRGYLAIRTQQAFDDAGWWGVTTGTINNAIVKTPDFELHALPLLSYWKGNFVTFIVIALFSLFTWQLYREANQMSGKSRSLMQALLLLWSVNHVVAFGCTVILFPYVGHFGIAFLSFSDMTLLGFALVYWSLCSRYINKNNHAASKLSFHAIL